MNGQLTVENLRIIANCSECPASEFETMLEDPMWNCDGTPNYHPGGGNWLGHVFPGTIFIFWGCHWLLGFIRHYFECQQHSRPYVSKTCYRFLWCPERWPLEAYVKFLMPIINILLEVWLAHGWDGYKNVICYSGEKRGGRIYGEHVGNWQHAYMYPGFILSGLVDLVNLHTELPHGTSLAFLSLGLTCPALLMMLHKKHSPMEIFVHATLFYSMMSTAVCTALEAAWRENPLLTAGRTTGMFLQGAWFIAAARMLYGGFDAWRPSTEDDMAPVMNAPILFMLLTCTIMIGVLSMFALGYIIYNPGALALRYSWGKPKSKAATGEPTTEY